MGETIQHDPFYITAENLTSRSPYVFSNFDLALTIPWRTALIFKMLHTELVHLFTNNDKKYMLKSLRFRLMRIGYTILPPLEKYIIT